MPAGKTQSTIARQWQLLKELPSRPPGFTTAQLTDRLSSNGFKVTKRTVERDLQVLSTVFPVLSNDKGIPHGWYLDPSADLDLPGITMADALSLTVVEDLVKPLLPAAVTRVMQPRFRQARTKLATLSADNANARWIHKVRQVPPTLPLLPPKIDGQVLETVQEALLNDRRLDVQYRRPGEN